MRARDVMTTDVISVGPETSVTDLAQLILDRRISGTGARLMPRPTIGSWKPEQRV